MSPSKLTLRLAVIIILVTSGVAQDNDPELREVSACSCHSLGCELVVECTITGAGATVWQGTLFDGCLNKKITLRHSEFTSGREIIETCGGNQSIIGRANSTENGSFISYISVIISDELIGKTIECANESGHIVGRKEIDSITAALQPPYNITLSEINMEQLSFTWDSALTRSGVSSESVQYIVNASNCGLCSHIINSNSVTCNFTITSKLLRCTIAIQTVACGRTGSVSDLFVVTLNVPGPPKVYVMQVTEILTLIVTAFNKTELLTLSDENVITATSYTIIYSDSSSGKTCGSAMIPASSCGDTICSNVLEVSSTSCVNFINISVRFYASHDGLGNGHVSEPTLITLQLYNDTDTRSQDYPLCKFEEITVTTVGVVTLLILILFTVMFVSIVVALIRSKRLIQKELKNIKESQDKRVKCVYEEIRPLEKPTIIETTENAAYTCISRMCANPSL